MTLSFESDTKKLQVLFTMVQSLGVSRSNEQKKSWSKTNILLQLFFLITDIFSYAHLSLMLECSL